MRVLILGIDALEYNLVEELNLRHLKQVEYGKTILTTSKILTPILWATFITGTLNHGINSFFVRKSLLARIGGKILDNLGIGPAKKSRDSIRKVLLKVGISTSPVDRTDLKCETTIFDYAKHPMAISIPAYNEWKSIHKMRLKYSIIRLIEEKNEKRIEECIELNWKIFNEKYRKVEECLNETGWDLMMVHFLILDTIGHLYWNKPSKVKDAYRYIDMKMGKLLDKVSKDIFTLIVSDHGMEKGEHTDHGFYSSSIRLNLNKPMLSDFYSIIIRKLKG